MEMGAHAEGVRRKKGVAVLQTRVSTGFLRVQRAPIIEGAGSGGVRWRQSKGDTVCVMTLNNDHSCSSSSY